MSLWHRIWGLQRSNAAAPGPFERLWHGFLTGRMMLALAVLALLWTERMVTGTVADRVLWLAGAYFIQTVVARIALRRHYPRRGPALHWICTLAVDVLASCLLQLWHASAGYSFVALFGLPVLMAAAVGSFSVMVGTVLSVLVALMFVTLWPRGLLATSPQQFLQSLLAGLGFFVLGLLVHQMASRLLREEQEGRKSRQAALLQSQVNALVISNLDDGVLVVDRKMRVDSANPAALEMLGLPAGTAMPFSLEQNPVWRPLVALIQYTLRRHAPQAADLSLVPPGHSPVGLRARAWMTPGIQARRGEADVQCVAFLHDLRSIEAQVRTEKLASMGRMSAAVAHEIRNPLSAIIQANALLAEDLADDPGAQRLTTMVRQNAERLSRIAEDILDVARVQRQIDADEQAEALALDHWVRQSWDEWREQAPAQRTGELSLNTAPALVVFGRDHLRRVLVNLLDNALRYKGPHADSLQVHTALSAHGQAMLQVWSDGAPLEKSVERHLFEPFFSSESRSSGLGLYLCRELCERHGASIGYQRIERATARGPMAGNAFTVQFRRPVQGHDGDTHPLTELVV
ncbi:PAS domain-containing protein [Corticibacter populi]|uniref:histidine kinase n=1 Tax=Corticibacter populi TaxID=1550736 RepID=A0A3M6QP62_9BURK|nr:ATP-binding protein [Corticibacter populi]RMX04838.1 PAS domain-containing protein [Corticibacter populi]RZS33743.1 two-component system sensor histidine kinase PilS (NtrC family) [Corticibacter populi]